MKIKPPLGKLTSYILKSASSDTVCCHTKWLFSQQKLMCDLMRLLMFCYLNWMNMSDCATIFHLPPPGDSTSMQLQHVNTDSIQLCWVLHLLFFFKCHLNPETFFNLSENVKRRFFFVNNNQYTFVRRKNKKHLHRWAFLKRTSVEM